MTRPHSGQSGQTHQQEPCFFGTGLTRHEAFWERCETDRPLLGIVVGFYAHERFPSTMRRLPVGRVQPEDIHTDCFLDECDRLYQTHARLGDDYPFVASPFAFVPWMEAIMGCPVVASETSLWAEPCVTTWEGWNWRRPSLAEPWPGKLLELMRALVEHSAGRHPVSGTLMRGPVDMLAAMRGAANLPLDFVDCPDVISEALDLCASVWIEVGKAQHTLIPDCAEGYMDGDRGFRFWAPERAIWLQEDAMALLSPRLYREIVLPVDRHIAAQFPAVAFHLHDSGMWAIDELVAAPEIDVLELNLEAASTDVEATFSGWRRIHGRKPLIIWRLYEDGFWPWLDRVLDELPPGGLSIQVTVRDLEQARQVKQAFDQRFDRTKEMRVGWAE